MLLIFVSFLTVVFLSFSVMTHGSNGSMQNNCPFSAFGASLCVQDVFTTIFNHISAYKSFFNIPTYSYITIFFFFFASYCKHNFYIFIDYFLYKPLIYIRRVINSPPFIIYNRKILRWLSLFENSPSYIKSA